MKENVYIGEIDLIQYPQSQYYSPASQYPEYCYRDVASEKNEVYDTIRQGFFELGYDSEHYGKPNWNPLGTIIQKGDTVLVKPNWVFHKNVEPISHDMDCMVTHPSILRVVIDYVLIALGGTGRVIIGDSPIQLCDFKELMEVHGYNRLWDFYKERNISLEIVDFRGVIAKIEKDRTFTGEVDDNLGIVVKLNEISAFHEKAHADNFRITNYPPAELSKHHTQSVHEYNIHPFVLEANVIINLPKPKAHRKAGITACMKNFVGINSRKECLPHHTKYSVDEGGDEYYRRSFLRSLSSDLRDMYLTLAYSKNRYTKFLSFCTSVIDKLGRILSRDNYSEGSWYGNDTIWRTIIDLNLILKYSNKLGEIQNQPQRRVLNICDMIIVGEKEGPMEPTPKPIGLILIGEDGFYCDIVISKIFGCDYGKIKYLDYLMKLEDENLLSQLNIMHNNSIISYDKFLPLIKWQIQFSDGWNKYFSK